jgi:predicted ester cyclase
MSTGNKSIVERLFKEGWNKGDPAGFDETVTAEYIQHEHPRISSVKPGLEGLKRMVAVYRAAFPDLSITMEDLIESNDKVVVRYTLTGTHMGNLNGIRATQRKIAATGISIYAFDSGKIVEGWTVLDALSLMHLDFEEVSETLGLIQEFGPSTV